MISNTNLDETCMSPKIIWYSSVLQSLRNWADIVAYYVSRSHGTRLGVLETWVFVSRRLETRFYKSWSGSWSWNLRVLVLVLVLEPSSLGLGLGLGTSESWSWSWSWNPRVSVSVLVLELESKSARNPSTSLKRLRSRHFKFCVHMMLT